MDCFTFMNWSGKDLDSGVGNLVIKQLQNFHILCLIMKPKQMFPKIFFLILLGANIAAQNVSDQGVSEKGDIVISSSIGLLNPGNFSFSFFGLDGSGNPSPSINLDLDYRVVEDINIGLFGSYYQVDASYEDDLAGFINTIGSGELDDILSQLGCLLFGTCEEARVTERVNTIIIGGKVYYSRPLIDGVETYLSANAGYGFNRRKTLVSSVLNQVSEELQLDVKVPSFVYYTSIGARYYKNESIGIYGEIGYGNSHLIKLGASYKL